MAETSAPAGVDANAAGVPFYEKQRQQLKELLQKKRALERSLASTEESIYQRETDYLDNTPLGNIITGFDNYTKGTSSNAATAQRRKQGPAEANRVFSRCSISYNANAAAAAAAGEAGATTPGGGGSVAGSIGAPTPVSAGFKDGVAAAIRGGSGQATPPGTAGVGRVKKGGAGGGGGAGGDEEDGDGKDSKKVRISFGASRKA